MAGAAATTLLLLTTAAAQTAPNAPRLVQTGQVFARGDGSAQPFLLVTPDRRRALTSGSERDLVWWDLPARRVLRHIDPPEYRMRRLQLHPVEPWLVWLADDGSGLRVDLDTGRSEALTKEQIAGLTMPAGQDWLRDDPQRRWGAAATPGGAPPAHPEKERAGRGAASDERAPAWITDADTTLEVTDGELLLRGKAWWQLFALSTTYCAAPVQLAFSRDGSFLASIAKWQTQLVDAAGREVATLPGPCVLTAGTAPDEFWVVTWNAMQRWSGTSRAFVGAKIPCEGAGTSSRVLVRDGKLLRPPTIPSFIHFDETIGFAVPSALGATLHLSSSKSMDLEPMRLVFTMLSSSPPTAEEIASRKPGVLRRHGANAQATHAVEFEAKPCWLALVADQTLAAVGLVDGTVQLFTAATLQPVTKAKFAVPFVAAVALGPEQLLVSTGDRLQRLDAKTLAVLGDMALPDGMSRVDRLVASPDGRRLAISCGSDVRILTIE
ncbi:MAG: hypothetical protein ACK6D1_13890 [Planctomycetota bacterium]|jgi:hypothetical protein